MREEKAKRIHIANRDNYYAEEKILHHHTNIEKTHAKNTNTRTKRT